jgi:hypothetical protein
MMQKHGLAFWDNYNATHPDYNTTMIWDEKYSVFEDEYGTHLVFVIIFEVLLSVICSMVGW